MSAFDADAASRAVVVAPTLSPVEKALLATVRMMGGRASFWNGGPRREIAERLVGRGILERVKGSDHLPTKTANPFDRYCFSPLGVAVSARLVERGPR